MYQFLLHLFLWTAAGVSCQDGPIVQTQQGLIRGRSQTNLADGSSYWAFQGIPFAQPPVGELRFQPPVPHESWEGILQTTNLTSQCVQGTGVGTEDCLYLSVFTPGLPDDESNSTESRAVLVWVHGGAFTGGTALGIGVNGPDYFILEDIVVCTIDYRVNVFGFLSTLDEAAEGNAGLKDQVAALQWIHDNIDRFGGDPERITVIGGSAGGSSIQHLVHSSLTEGLFHQAISHSGSIMDRWAFQRYPLLQLGKLAAAFNIPTDDHAYLVRQFQALDAQVLYRASTDVDVMGYFAGIDAGPFVPSAERVHDGAFLSESPYDSLINGHYRRIPYISGYNTGDGSFALGENRNAYNENYQLLVPKAMNVPLYSENASAVGALVKNFFYGSGPVTDVENFIINFSDEEFVRAIRLSIEHMKLDMPVYVYRFAYEGSRSNPDPLVGHGEEIWFFMHSVNPENATDTAVREKCVRLWSNFIKLGNPTPEPDPLVQNITWLPAYVDDPDATNYLNIDVDFTTSTNPDQSRWQFWNLIYSVYGVPPYYTY